MHRTALLLSTALLCACGGAPLREQLPPHFEDLATPELAEVEYLHKVGQTPQSFALVQADRRSYDWVPFRVMAADARWNAGNVDVELAIAGPAPASEPSWARVVAAVFALDPPDLEHEGRVDLVPAIGAAPLDRKDLTADAQGLWSAQFTIDPGRVRWNAKGQAAFLVSFFYRQSDGIIGRENKDVAVERPAN